MTAQYPDFIVYKGEMRPMFTNPLEDYFDKYPDKCWKRGRTSTDLWRGYVATFEIKDNRLFLKDINIEIPMSDGQGDYQMTLKSVINEVFPNQELIKLDWWTGTLVLPSGKLVEYVHMGYCSTYEHYTLLEIKNGNLINEKHFGHDEYNAFNEQQQFQVFKKMDEDESKKTDLQTNSPLDDESLETLLRLFLEVIPNHEQDVAKEIKWLYDAAKQGNVTAQFNLGVLYDDSEDVIDKEEAVEWYRKAAEQGHEGAINQLKKMGIARTSSGGEITMGCLKFFWILLLLGAIVRAISRLLGQ